MEVRTCGQWPFELYFLLQSLENSLALGSLPAAEFLACACEPLQVLWLAAHAQKATQRWVSAPFERSVNSSGLHQQ